MADGRIQTKAAGIESLGEEAEELAAEDLGELPHREEEVGLARDPSLVIEAQPPAGDDQVDMRMEVERLAPGVEHGDESGYGAQATPSDPKQGLGRSREEQAVDLSGMAPEVGMQRWGKSEDLVEVGHRQKMARLGLAPESLIKGLALWAVAIPTRVVLRLLVTALVAPLEMAAQLGRPAGEKIADHASLISAQRFRPWRACTQDVGQLQARRARTSALAARHDLRPEGIERAPCLA